MPRHSSCHPCSFVSPRRGLMQGWSRYVGGWEGVPLVENDFFWCLGCLVSSFLRFWWLWFQGLKFSTCPKFINSCTVCRELGSAVHTGLSTRGRTTMSFVQKTNMDEWLKADVNSSLLHVVDAVLVMCFFQVIGNSLWPRGKRNGEKCVARKLTKSADGWLWKTSWTLRRSRRTNMSCRCIDRMPGHACKRVLQNWRFCYVWLEGGKSCYIQALLTSAPAHIHVPRQKRFAHWAALTCVCARVRACARISCGSFRFVRSPLRQTLDRRYKHPVTLAHQFQDIGSMTSICATAPLCRIFEMSIMLGCPTSLVNSFHVLAMLAVHGLKKTSLEKTMCLPNLFGTQCDFPLGWRQAKEINNKQNKQTQKNAVADAWPFTSLS